MSLDKITTKSTSKSSADTDDIVLRQTKTTRLIFRPQLVTNDNNVAASVKGIFIFQRRGKNNEWQFVNKTTLAKLKKSEGIKLSLRSEELLIFYQGISRLYQLYQQFGLPQGSQTFSNISNKLQEVAGLSDEDLELLVKTGTNINMGVQALTRLLKWAGNVSKISDVLDQLERIDRNSIHTFTGIAMLREAKGIWDSNTDNSDEEFWQTQFTEQSYLLEQIFNYPIALINDKAYIGGKSINNTGGNIVDFLYKNVLTNSVMLVEIKTPNTPLLGPEYRDGIYNASHELTGTVLQVLDYRKSLTENINTLRDNFDTYDPPCKVIIGNTSQLDNLQKKKSFELFRRHFNGVEVVTYDEVFLRLSHLLNVLEGEGNKILL